MSCQEVILRVKYWKIINLLLSSDVKSHILYSLFLFCLFRVVYNEVIQTSKYYMRDVTAIKSAWLLELAPHFYQQGTVRARHGFQTVSLLNWQLLLYFLVFRISLLKCLLDYNILQI